MEQERNFLRPADIERESMRIIGGELAQRGIALPPEHEAVVKRVIHTTADFDYVGSLRFTDGGAEAAVAALRGGCSIVTDTNMAKAGISKAALSKLGGEAVCFMADPETVRQARERGVTRAAVWKEMEALRREGWPIESSPRKGYRLAGPPPALSGAYISAQLPPDSLFSGKVLVEPVVDSTNTRLKARAAAGAPEGTALIAEEQTGGRGTHGRSFQSPRGDGLYLSVLLRPRGVRLEDLLTLTGWVGAAARRAVERACGAPARIKWLNDLYLNGKKLCGILTELSFLGESGEPDYVVAGMGINMNQTAETFQAQGLGDIATSLALEGFPVERNHLAVCLLSALEQMTRDFPDRRADYLADYRAHCVTLGRRVSFEGPEGTRTGTASGVDGSFALLVSGDDGREHTVNSGTVTML